MSELISRDELAECWQADSLNPEHVAAVMGKRQADLLCFDAPFSAKTHAGHAKGKMTADRAAAYGVRATSGAGNRELRYARRKGAKGESGRRDLAYAAWTPADVALFTVAWAPYVRGWWVSITDHVLAPAWERAFEAMKLCVFPPLPLVERGSNCRMVGDGPSSWTTWIVVARPRTPAFAKWGTLRGAYDVAAGGKTSREKDTRIVGGKPVLAMQCIVADYSRLGQLVVDPTMGAGTTGVAAKGTGRRFIGCEVDEARARDASANIDAVNMRQLTLEKAHPRAVQLEIAQ